MGPILSRLENLFGSWGTTQARIVMLGLDAAGKTTVLYKIKLNETVQTIPTIGFNVETVTPVKGLTFTVWDIGGQEKIRALWRHYTQDVDGLIFVVDSSDRERLPEARDELFGVLEEDAMWGVPVVVMANKQDLPGAVGCAGLAERLNLNKLRDRQWYTQATCATTGEGIYEGLAQLSKMVKDFKKEGKRRSYYS